MAPRGGRNPGEPDGPHAPAHDPGATGPRGESGESQGLLDGCDGCDGSTFEGRRDEAILRVFIDTGARLAEVANLRLDSEDEGDVDLDGGALRVLGKGSRQRLLPIGVKTTKAIDRDLRKRGQHPQAYLPWLWVGKKGRMTASGIRQMIWRPSSSALAASTHTSSGIRSLTPGWPPAAVRAI